MKHTCILTSCVVFHLTFQRSSVEGLHSLPTSVHRCSFVAQVNSKLKTENPMYSGAETWGDWGDGPPKNLRWGDGPCIGPPNIQRSSVVGCVRKDEQSKKMVLLRNSLLK